MRRKRRERERALNIRLKHHAVKASIRHVCPHEEQ